jgi:hypothetical protein
MEEKLSHSIKETIQCVSEKSTQLETKFTKVRFFHEICEETNFQR